MGLFDRFRKRVHEVAEQTDADALSADAGSDEALAALASAEQASIEPTTIIQTQSVPEMAPQEEEWEDLDTIEPVEPQVSDDWDEWEEEEEIALPQDLSRRERKLVEKAKKADAKREKQLKKEMKKRGAVEVARPKGSKVDLSMMRTTTGRQLVSVSSAPKGSVKTAEVETEAGTKVEVDLGGGVVQDGGRIIKAGGALDALLEELEWVLLESDISSDAVTAIIDALRRSLVGSRLRKGADLAKVLEAALKRALRSLLAAGYWDFDATVNGFVEAGDTPVVVMLVGVNGTGKTTTAAKIAHRLLGSGKSVIAAAGDTFRAGAIQQLESHCENLGIRCVSSQRGGDTAAIARDAIESARAKGVDVVLVDTAGRMQNKVNLMNELNKVRRVANPHLTLFVGDSLAGNDAVEQARMFQEIMKFDGAVLTKVDTDAKGGAGLSIAFATGRPIVFAGVGQGYDDLKQFDPDWLLEQMFD
ncbi:signal recognition particle-docking protein FtsY [Candidatus Poseidoniaceae archaeon]|nr:signal recognition particle-docking protein FtsY [Euryarchaeota archaeon]MDB0004718.1 signal recognition particle-docking protein FtsY [Candidatus Poseidoniaceae archaeon]